MENYNYLKDINHFKNWSKIVQINKGWSNDKKYFIKDNNGNELLLRLSDIMYYDQKKLEFDNLILVSKLGINTSKPIDFGICDNGNMVYSILTWIDGQDAIDVLATFCKEKQYQLGVEAGEILRKIHTIKPLIDQEPWEIRYQRKIDRAIDAYNSCGYKIENDKEIINFIRNYQGYLKDRPMTLQHGDYHLGNMIISDEGDLGIIDFNRSSYGDPWEEYDRYVFSWNISLEFANGQLHGYFNNKVPNEFFKLMSLYNARNLIASIPWSMTFGEEELNVAIENIKTTSDAYNGFETYIPSWYREIEGSKI